MSETKADLPAGAIEDVNQGFDLHVHLNAEAGGLVTLYTVSRGGRSLCVNAPIAIALDSIRAELQKLPNAPEKDDEDGEQKAQIS